MVKAGVYYATYGHWTLSLLNAGYEVAWHVQPDIKDPRWKDKTAELILQANFPKISTSIGENVDIICGSPPCIGFSQGNPKSSPTHWANKNFVNCFNKIAELEPKYFLIEMVPPIFTKGKEVLKEALTKVKAYNIHYKIFEVKDYGSPAKRSRVYFYGIKNKHDFNPLDRLPFKKPLPLKKILDPLKEKFDNYKPDNYLLQSIYRKDGTLIKGPFSVIEKGNRVLDPNGHMFTITSRAYRDTIHYSTKRLLAIPEVSALMGFPPTYRFMTRNISKMCNIIASGVDIRFTSYLLKYLKAPKEFKKYKLVVDLRLKANIDKSKLVKKTKQIINTSELGKIIEKIGVGRGVIHRDYMAHCLRWTFVKKMTKRGMNILDLGCGRGMLLKLLYSSKLKPNLYVGLDIRKHAIEEVMSFKTNFPVIGIVNDIRTGIIGHVGGDFNEEFDLVVCFEVIEHFEPKYLSHVLKEIYRVLKPKGYLLLSTPNYDGIHHAKNHIHEYTQNELFEYLNMFFTIERSHGTFASQKDIKPFLSSCEEQVWLKLKAWFDPDVLSIIFASLHPSQSRNILWVCRKGE